MKKMIIDDKLFEIFPDTTIGVLKLTGLNNKANSETDALLRDAEKFARTTYEGTPMLDLPEMKKWREAYKTLGVKKGTRVSMESLIKRVVKGNDLPNINPLVDLYNGISLRYVFPCGGEDLKTTQGDIKLTFALGTESFYQIGSDESEPPEENEVVYKDDLGCLCRRWNWREADRTKLTEETEEAILVIESLSADRRSDMEAALDDLAAKCSGYLNAEVEKFILNRDTTSCNL